MTVPKGTVIPGPRVAEPGISGGVLSLSRGLLLQASRLSTEFPACAGMTVRVGDDGANKCFFGDKKMPG